MTERPLYAGMLDLAIDDLDQNVTQDMERLDLAGKLRLLGLLQSSSNQLATTIAALEAEVASEDWGRGPRGGAVHDLEGPGWRAKRGQSMKYTWEDRRLLFDLLFRDRTNLETGEAPDEAEIWRDVDLVLSFGKWEPRSTPLKEAGWSPEDISGYRKKEAGRRTVKVTLEEVNESEETTAGEDVDDAASTDDSGGPDGGPEGVGAATGPEAAGSGSAQGV